MTLIPESFDQLRAVPRWVVDFLHQNYPEFHQWNRVHYQQGVVVTIEDNLKRLKLLPSKSIHESEPNNLQKIQLNKYSCYYKSECKIIVNRFLKKKNK